MVAIYVASHIEGPLPNLQYCHRVQAGAAHHHIRSGHRDDTGDNISSRNKMYAEMTVLYWIWKNTTEKIVGLCHYRRYFSPILFGTRQNPVSVNFSTAQSILSIDATGRLFEFELGISTMIVPQLQLWDVSISHSYCRSNQHRASDWHAMLQAFSDIYPNEAAEAHRFFNSRRPIHAWCIFITRRDILNKYCDWLFPLLFHIESLISVPEEPRQMRVIGFLSERLFAWWTASRGLSLIHRPVLWIRDFEHAAQTPQAIADAGDPG